MNILQAVLNNDQMKAAYQNACLFRGLNPTDLTIQGKRVGKHKFTCTQRLIASIVFETYTL